MAVDMAVDMDLEWMSCCGLKSLHFNNQSQPLSTCVVSDDFNLVYMLLVHFVSPGKPCSFICTSFVWLCLISCRCIRCSWNLISYFAYFADHIHELMIILPVESTPCYRFDANI
jgi:hypothetical protein